MNNKPDLLQRPKKLVVYLHNVPIYVYKPLKDRMIQNDVGGPDPSQLVHEQRIPQIPVQGSIDRLFLRAGLKDKQSPFDNIVLAAHTFVLSNYQPGDQVILLVDLSNSSESLRKAAEVLARHLHDGTRPGGRPFNISPNDKVIVSSQRIPIYCYCVVGEVGSNIPSTSEFYDDLKSSFPLGIERIILSVRSADTGWIHSTTLDMNGAVVSREMHLTNGYLIYNLFMIRDGLIYATKDVIHYKPQYVPHWDQNPAWTWVYHSSRGAISGNPFSECIQPLGMRRYELWKYPEQHTLKMVWKSSRQ